MSARASLAIVVIGLTASAPEAGTQRPQFRAGVDVVQLNVAVTDGPKAVNGLTAKDFDVRDNGVQQAVSGVSRDLLPIDVTMAIDTSESLEWIQTAIVTAANRIRDSLKAADRLSLLTFNQRIHDRLALQPATDAGISLGRPSGQTSLHDVVGTVLATRPVSERRQIAIVFTDGYDTTSLLSEDDVLAIARRSHAAVFFVAGQVSSSRIVMNWVAGPAGMPAPSFSLRRDAAGQHAGFFQRIASATGGLVQVTLLNDITVISNGRTVVRPQRDLLVEPFLKALDYFRTSYVVTYTLAGVPRAGWHEVSVKVTRPGTNYKVRTRNGYTGG